MAFFFSTPASPKYINRNRRLDQITLTKSLTIMTFQTSPAVGDKFLSTICLMFTHIREKVDGCFNWACSLEYGMDQLQSVLLEN